MPDSKPVLSQLHSFLFGAAEQKPAARQTVPRMVRAPDSQTSPQDSPALPSKLPAGTLQVIGLAGVRMAMGPRWDTAQDRIRGIVESVLRRRLEPTDAHYRVDVENFIVLFTRLGRREGEFKAGVILREIESLLVGEFDGGETVRLATSIAEVDRALVLDRVTTLDELMSHVRNAARQEDETADGVTFFTDTADPAPTLASGPAMGAGPDMADLDQSLAGLFQKKTSASFLKECEAGFYPAFSTRKRSFSIYEVMPIHTPSGQEAKTVDDPLIDDRDELSFYLDRYILTTGLLGLHRMLSSGRKGIVSLRVSFHTMSIGKLRDTYLSRLKEMPAGVTRHLAIGIAEIPDGTPASRVAEVLTYAQPFCGSRFVCIRPDPALVDLYADTGCHAFSTALSDAPDNMSRRYQAISSFVKRADWHRRESILTGVASNDDLHSAVTAGVSFVEGQAVAPLMDTPGYRDGLDTGHIPGRSTAPA